ncbi:MAG: reactive intermediate/imine deaminase [Actinomyces sp.]|nr:MAG: reactive intermediate/imine deaminase [Actinomyces sp.]
MPASVAVSTTDAPAAVGPYSQAVSVGSVGSAGSAGTGGTVYVSGQVPLDPATGALVDGGIQAQAERVLTSIGAILEAAGLGYADVVKTTVLLADISDFKAVNEVYARFFTGPVLPARAAFAVAALPLGARVEIEAVAVRP